MLEWGHVDADVGSSGCGFVVVCVEVVFEDHNGNFLYNGERASRRTWLQRENRTNQKRKMEMTPVSYRQNVKGKIGNLVALDNFHSDTLAGRRRLERPHQIINHKLNENLIVLLATLNTVLFKKRLLLSPQKPFQQCKRIVFFTATICAGHQPHVPCSLHSTDKNHPRQRLRSR